MAAETSLDEALSPAERRRRKVRDAIVGAAEAIFAEEGEAGISMRRIAERIDYSPAALYKYFDSKEALFREIREGFFERLLTRMRAVCEDIEAGPMLCTACLRAYVHTGLEEPSHYQLAFSGGFTDFDPDEGGYAFAAAEHLREMIAQSMEEGWFRPAPLDLAASSVWAGSHGLTMLAVSVPAFPMNHTDCEQRSLEEVIDFHGEHVMRGFATPKLLSWLEARGPSA